MRAGEEIVDVPAERCYGVGRRQAHHGFEIVEESAAGEARRPKTGDAIVDDVELGVDEGRSRFLRAVGVTARRGDHAKTVEAIAVAVDVDGELLEEQDE